LPSLDTYTFTVTGRAWVDQQWGSQVAMALVYRTGGFAGLALLRATLVGLTFGFLWLACRARGASPRTSSLLTLAGLVVGVLNTGMRPQTLAYPLFTATLWILAGRRLHPRRLWLLPAMGIVWANLHGSFALLPLVIALAVVEDMRDHAEMTRTTVIVGAVATATTLANPFGIGAWRYAIGISTNARILDQIQEWQATSVRTVAGALFFLSALGVAAYLARRATPASWLSLLWLATFFVLALPALRGIIWWSFVFPVVLAGLQRPTSQPDADRRGSSTMNLIVACLVVATVAIELPWWRDRVDPSTGASSLLQLAPQHLVDATRSRAGSNARLFVSEPIASWFEFSLPDAPVFVDSRIELFPDGAWNAYQNVLDGRQGWQATLDRWRVDAVVLLAEDTGLASRIATDPGWRLAYRDDQGSLFVRA
jgi:hypothetical protein